MGLDMYLYAHESGKSNSDSYEIAYWRKANQIRNWFVNHIPDFSYEDNCGKYDISEDLLVQLHDDINSVLENHQLASVLLPTSSGFFFGSTEYDECYVEDLEHTKEIIEKIFSEFDFAKGQIYYTEWW